MSAKFLRVFSDENSDLKKQIGCMAGFFQMFERHQFLSPRLSHRLTHKRSISSGHAHSSSNSSSPITEFVLEKSHSKNCSENQRVSMESSRTSFSSSSCSSSFSSLDCNKSTQEPQPNESLDFRDVVKDSIYKEARGLSIKTLTKEKDEFKKKNAFKHRDSPRPDSKSRIAMQMNESLRVLARLKEAHCEEEPRPSFESKTSSKIHLVSRDSPRYSYDGRDDAKLVSKLKESPRLSLDSSTDSCKISMNRKSPKSLSFEQESSSQIRHSVVVAKLMGLEAMPNNVQEQPTIISSSFNNNVCGKKKKNKCQERKPMTTTARIPIETAPWRQQEKLHVAKKAPFRHRPEFVHSEIEKRLKELEILQTNKDLMDLKLLLDAIQVPKSTNRASESPIVVMKPMKPISKASASPSSAVVPLEGLSKLKMSRRSETLEKKNRPVTVNNKTEENCLPRPPSRIQLPRKEINGNSIKTSGSISPRLQQKKLGEEKKIRRPPTPSSDLNQPQRQSPSKQSSESVSPRGKLGRKPAKKTVSVDAQSSEASTETRKDETSLKSYSNISLVSTQADIEVTSADRSSEHNKSSVNLKEDAATAAPPEQPSPMSVLDASFCQVDMMQSPVKTISNSFKDSSSEINHKKLKSIEILVQKLSQLSSEDGETQTTDHIALLCDTQKPDHRYVSEILLASSLLMKDLTAMPLQLHSSGHPINPDLFLVLEQTKSQTNILRPKNDTEKLHRKLIFDVVNEVLVQKLELTSPYIKTRKLSRILPTGQRLLRQVCSEIDQLENEKLER
ncbi:protein LONGIFOLIA 1-like [Dioscorea cayenensis subsp. rotundata]|uniref:Protein LONGIFOLIA 1-like n=1 Tax=Dioscorea cayennensis subsp. rotundata TaxID=55577 RepID=A0AB40BVG6_DIOCR|nr:protein LONGIFOLIA 1-like [Dioscorea cayenensis subsp. rotundata]